MLKKIFKYDNMKKIVNKTITQKINSNDEYCIVNSKTKLYKNYRCSIEQDKTNKFEN